MSKVDDRIEQLLKKQGLENEPDDKGKPAAAKKPAPKAAKKKVAGKKKSKHTSKKASKKKAIRKTDVKKKAVAVKRVNGVDPERFAHAYVAYHCNATVAYLSLRPDVKHETAATEAYKVLRKPEVQNVLWPLLEGLLEKESAQSEWVIKRWLEQAEASPLDYFSIKNDGSLGGMDLSEITKAQRRNLKSIRYNRTVITKDDSETVNESWHVTVVDQQKAVELLAKMLGMLQPKLDPETEDRIGDLLERGVKRIRQRMDVDAWKDVAIEGNFSEVG